MQRHHDPSEKKLQWLRNRGVAPVSRAVVAAGVTGAGIVAAGLIAGEFVEAWRRLAVHALGTGDAVSLSGVLGVMRAGLKLAAFSIGGVGLAAVAGWLILHYFQAGPGGRMPGRPADEDPGYYSRADTSRADRAAGVLISVLLIGAAVSAALQIATLIGSAAPGQSLLGVAVRPVATIFLPALLGAVVLDWLWCRYSYTVSARMTEQEKRREAQEAGTPQITQYRRTRRFRERG